MKIKMFIPLALILCLVFSLCACGTTANTDGTTTAPATTVAATTSASTEATTTAAATTAPATEAEVDADATASDFTEEDALELVKTSYEITDDSYYYQPRGTYEIDGTSYYAIDLRKSLDTNTTYISSYFVTLDGSEIHKGYIAGEEAVISDQQPTIEVTEDNAVKVVEAAYDFEDGCFVTYRGVEEIDGVKYFAVDLRRSLEANTTYLSTYFVTETGAITLGYYEGGTPVLGE